MPNFTQTTLAALSLITAVTASVADASDRRFQLKVQGPQLGLTASILPDLIVTPNKPGQTGLPNTGVCGAWQPGYNTVHFRVKNVGAAQAGQSDLVIVFKKNGASVGGGAVQIPPMGPGQQRFVTYPVPAAAQPGYNDAFEIVVAADTSHDVVETNDKNNSMAAICVGPTS